MAVVDYTEREEAGVIYVTWAAAASGDTFQPVRTKDGKTPADIFFSAAGTFGSAALALHGSNDNVSFEAEVDRLDTTISLTAAGRKSVRDAPLYFLPVLTGADASGIVARLVYRYI